MDQSTKSGKRKAPVGPGQLYTLLSRATGSDRIQLINFDADSHIVVNMKAKEAMDEMRNNRQLEYVHPLKLMSGRNLCLFNIRSWNLHIDHFLSGKLYTLHSCILCFTETGHNITKRIDHHSGLERWKTVHKSTQHGLAISYDDEHVTCIEQLHTISNIESLPVIMEIDKYFTSRFVIPNTLNIFNGSSRSIN